MTRSLVLAAAVAAALAVVPRDARAWAPDQTQTCITGGFNLQVFAPAGQTFTPGQAQLDAVALTFENYSGAARDVTVTIRETDFAGAVVGSETASVPVGQNAVTFTFAAPLTVTPGATYMLQVATAFANVLVDGGNCGYAGGQAFPVDSAVPPDLTFATFGPCGNGTLDAGEACDDADHQSADCCDAQCQAVAAGAACGDDGSLCTNDTCDGAGTCSHVAAPAAGCGAAQATLAITDADDDAKDKLVFAWTKGAAVPSDFGAPLGDTAYQLCLYDGSGVVHTERVASGQPWAATKSGWVRKDKTGAADGVQTVTLKAGPAGKASVKWTAKGVNVPAFAPAIPLATPLQAQVRTSDAGCWEAAFYAADVKKNAAGKFSAKSVPVVPTLE